MSRDARACALMAVIASIATALSLPAVGVAGPTAARATHTSAVESRPASHCVTSMGDVGLKKHSIALGTIADRTGPISGLFAGAQQGAVAFSQYENARGGLCGRQVSIKFADSGTNCSQDRADTRSLIKRAFALVGSFSLYDGMGCGASVLAAHPTVPDVHVAVDPSAATPPNHFDLQPGPLGYATGMFTFYAAKYGSKVRHVGTISVNVPAAQARQKAIVDAAKSQGWRFTYSNSASPGTGNFTSNFQAMCGHNHIRIFFTATESVQNAATMMANERSVAACNGVINIIPVAYDSAFVPDFQGSPSDLDGIQGWTESALYFSRHEAAQIPEVARFKQWFHRTNPGKPLNIYAMFAWASGRLFEHAFIHASTADRRGVINALDKVKHWSDRGLVAPATPGSKTTGTHCYVLWTMKDGTFKRSHDPAITKANPGGYRCDGKFRRE
jgi:ABC-type branched-subunit amino acid transport system substrate-binding protein